MRSKRTANIKNYLDFKTRRDNGDIIAYSQSKKLENLYVLSDFDTYRIDADGIFIAVKKYVDEKDGGQVHNT